MSDILTDALLPEGLDEEAIQRVRDRLRARDAFVTVNYERVWARQRDAATKTAAEAAAAMPDYHGAIARCQAQVTFSGRVTEWSRCTRKPTKVRRFEEKKRKGYQSSGVLVVCGTHARAKNGIERWVKGDHWMDKGKPPTADEPIEPEYLA